MFKGRGIKIDSFSHIAQDAICLGSFKSKWGNKVFYGAVSDGDSSSQGSHFGSKFLVDQFAKHANSLYNADHRNEDLLRSIVLKITDEMLRYTPKNSHSELLQIGSNQICGELSATLLGFIVDKEKTLIMIAGDGELSINGKCGTIENDVIGPSALLYSPRSDWPKMMGYFYDFTTIPTDRLNNLVLSTDGIDDLGSYLNLSDNPDKFVSKIGDDASIDMEPKHRHDDTTVIILSRRGRKSSNPLPNDTAETICKSASAVRSYLGVLPENVQRIILRKEGRQSYNRYTEDNSVGITLYNT